MPGVPSGRACDGCRKTKKKVSLELAAFDGAQHLRRDESATRNNPRVRDVFAWGCPVWGQAKEDTNSRKEIDFRNPRTAMTGLWSARRWQ